MRLPDLQAAVEALVVHGSSLPDSLAATLTGGTSPAQRLLLHRRHYVTSLVHHLRGRYPSLVWLLGEAALIECAVEYVQRHPPRRPCLAEYGETFPAYLDETVATALPWAGDLARVEWIVGAAAVATDHASVPLSALLQAAHDADVGLDTLTCRVQPSLALLDVDWAVDALFHAFLEESPPPASRPEHAPGTLAISGSRGDFTVQRLEPAESELLAALIAGMPIGDALACAATWKTTTAPADLLARAFHRGWIGAVHSEALLSTPSAP
jgi:hypothetical protein